MGWNRHNVPMLSHRPILRGNPPPTVNPLCSHAGKNEMVHHLLEAQEGRVGSIHAWKAVSQTEFRCVESLDSRR